MPSGFTTTPEERLPRFITPKQLAALLGLSKSGVYRFIEKRQIRFYRFTGSLRFERRDIEAFIEKGRVEPRGQ
jgi:excisionase family DNA binding protein